MPQAVAFPGWVDSDAPFAQVDESPSPRTVQLPLGPDAGLPEAGAGYCAQWSRDGRRPILMRGTGRKMRRPRVHLDIGGAHDSDESARRRATQPAHAPHGGQPRGILACSYSPAPHSPCLRVVAKSRAESRAFASGHRHHVAHPRRLQIWRRSVERCAQVLLVHPSRGTGQGVAR